MDRQRINRISAVAPIVFSLMACGLVIVALLTGWEKGYKDEGAVAHIFQLLIVAELPIIAVFIATAEWKRVGRVAGWLALQGAALILALAPVALFKL